MSLSFDQLVFAKPFFLWLILALPVLWFRARDRRAVVLIARSVILALVILILRSRSAIGLARPWATHKGQLGGPCR